MGLVFITRSVGLYRSVSILNSREKDSQFSHYHNSKENISCDRWYHELYFYAKLRRAMDSQRIYHTPFPYHRGEYHAEVEHLVLSSLLVDIGLGLIFCVSSGLRLVYVQGQKSLPHGHVAQPCLRERP